ncbi:MAG TPA: hypothetical protein VGH20_06645 [Myxococcales bacterium]
MAPHPGWFARHRDLLAASVSGLVGALALGTSTYNVYLQRQQVRAQVWPRLNLDTDWTDDVVTLQVQNRGVGPAQVKRVRVWVDGQPQVDWVAAIGALLKLRRFTMPAINEVENEVMSPGQQIAPIKLSGAQAIELLRQRRRLGFEACYCSSLDDCWELRVPDLAQTSTTVAVKDCAPDARPFRSLEETRFDQALSTKTANGEDAGAPARTSP